MSSTVYAQTHLKKSKIDDKRQCIYSRNAMECRFAFNRLIGWMNLHEHGAPQNVMLYKTTAQSTMLFVDSVSTQNRCSNSTKEHKHQRITKYDQTTPQIPRSLMKYASAHQPQTLQKLFSFSFFVDSFEWRYSFDKWFIKWNSHRLMSFMQNTDLDFAAQRNGKFHLNVSFSVHFALES